MEKIIFERKLYSEIKKFLDDDEIIVIHGARQVGKTSLMKFIHSHLKKSNAYFIDLEDFGFLEICNKGVDELIKYLNARNYDLEKHLYLFIDEIQYLENPSSFLKIIFDHYKGKIKLIVSGSSSFEIKTKFKDSLVGRTINFELFPLSFDEYLLFKGYSLKKMAILPEKINIELRELYSEYAVTGGYPSIVLEPVLEKKERKLKQIINTYLKVDIRDIGRIRNLQKFNNLLEIVASQQGNLLNINELSITTGLAMQTIEEYLFILENTYVIKLVRPFYRNIRSELIKMPKLYFEDTGIASIIANKTFPNSISGSCFENTVFSELQKHFGSENLHYWRTNKGQEVDFVLNAKKPIPIEVKLTFTGKELTGLKYFCEKYNIEKATIITLNNKCKTSVSWLNVMYPWEIYKLSN
ncbi:MAG: ATP-binding protein [Bacteroidetes bacterium]|nr:ATP-binding protein [Bacteroidota bacterium]